MLIVFTDISKYIFSVLLHTFYLMRENGFSSFSLCLTVWGFFSFFILFFLFGKYTFCVCLLTITLVKLQHDRKNTNHEQSSVNFPQWVWESALLTPFAQHQEQMSKFPSAPWGLSLIFFFLMEGRSSFYFVHFFQKRPIRIEGIRKTTVFFFPQNFPLCFHAHSPWLSILCSSSQVLQRTIQGG